MTRGFGTPRLVVVGQVSGPFGVQGWVRVRSYTEPRENILGYSPWRLRVAGEWVSMAVLAGRRQGRGIVARLEVSGDRDTAERLLGADIAISREQLPAPEPDAYYWADLIGLEVLTREGVRLGRVAALMQTGANDVLVVAGERERLLPFIAEVVLDVDLRGGRVQVDWDPSF